jgi:hypothetical protein
MVNAVLNRSRPPLSRRRAGGAGLEGVKRDPMRMPSEAARKTAAELASRGEVAYWLVVDQQSKSHGGERRASARERVRLRSAKLLDAGLRFVCECQICDRSRDGVRLALSRNVRMSRRIAVHIDETGEVRSAKVAWRRGLVVGLRLYAVAPAGAMKPSDRHALKERYYGILD